MRPQKFQTASEALKAIESHNRVFVHGGAATPNFLLEGLIPHASRLRGVELTHIHTEGPARYADVEFAESFRVANLFVGANLRGRMDYDRVDYLPCFLSEIPALFRTGARSIDVALVQVSPPDHQGYCSLGASVDVARAAVDHAKIVIAQVNRQMPRVHGDGFIPMAKISAYVEVDEPLPELLRPSPSEIERKIGSYVAGLIEDGSTLQAGVGAIPDAVLAGLKGHRNLGLHSELLSEGAMELVKCGAINNSKKKVHAGKCVSSFLLGSRRLYDFAHDNPTVVQFGADYVNMPVNVARNPKVVAINSAVEVDLTGQICADSVGGRVISGVGGQMDFMRGAALSEGGKPIIAITSRTTKGEPRIVSQLRVGSGVVTTRAHVHYVVTEYGVRNLFGKTLSERARALIEIAHPDDREILSREWDRQKKKG